MCRVKPKALVFTKIKAHAKIESNAHPLRRKGYTQGTLPPTTLKKIFQAHVFTRQSKY
jgi:hypothetical protein